MQPPVEPTSPSGTRVEVEGLTGARLQAIAAIWRRDRRQLTVRFGGSSMEPTIPAGAEVLLLCGVFPALGEIAAVTFGDRIMVHRVVARPPSGAWILTRGDASAIPDPPIPEASVIGTVVRVRRDDRFVDPPPPPTSFGRRLALALCLLGLRARRPLGPHFIRPLWFLRRWTVLAPRALARSVRSALVDGGR